MNKKIQKRQNTEGKTSRLFREYVSRFPHDSFTKLLVSDAEYPGSAGSTAYAIITGDLDGAMFRGDIEVRQRLEEITGVTYAEMSKKYNTYPLDVYEAYVNGLRAEWGVWKD